MPRTRLTIVIWLALLLAGQGLAAQEINTAEGAVATGYVEINGVIDRTASRYLARVVEHARTEGIGMLVVHINTDGGEVLHARDMLKLLLDQAADGPRLIAFVDYRAISAGALIAYGHDRIYMTDTASIGDIGVIYEAPDGKMEYAPEKVETIVRTLLVQASEIRGWSKGLLLKMTARNQDLYKVVVPAGGVRYVIGDDLPEFLSRHPDIDQEDPKQVIVYRGEDRLLTLTGREAAQLGMATGLVDDLDALYGRLGIEPNAVVDLRPSTTERVAARVAPWAPILAGLAMMFILFEMKTPGVGLWAGLGALCGALFLTSQYYLDMADNLEFILLIAGVALLAVEMLTLFGGGLLAAAGGLLLLSGLVLSFLPDEMSFDPGDERFVQALGDATVSGLMALGVMAAGLAVFIIVVPRSRLSRRLAVESEISATSGGALAAAREPLIGRRGVARDPLHPGGLVSIDGEEYTALVEHGAFIEAGERLEVVAIALGELVVRAERGGNGDPSEER